MPATLPPSIDDDDDDATHIQTHNMRQRRGSRSKKLCNVGKCKNFLEREGNIFLSSSPLSVKHPCRISIASRTHTCTIGGHSSLSLSLSPLSLHGPSVSIDRHEANDDYDAGGPLTWLQMGGYSRIRTWEHGFLGSNLAFRLLYYYTRLPKPYLGFDIALGPPTAKGGGGDTNLRYVRMKDGERPLLKCVCVFLFVV